MLCDEVSVNTEERGEGGEERDNLIPLVMVDECMLSCLRSGERRKNYFGRVKFPIFRQ